MRFNTHVAGIPCQCEIIHYIPARPMQITGPGMGDAFAPEPAEVEYRLLDRQGTYAPWLEKKLSNQEVAYQLDTEIASFMFIEKNQKYPF